MTDRITQVDRLQERVNALKTLTAQTGSPPDPRDLDELSAALEQLQLSEIAVRHQNGELAAACDALEIERSRYRELFELAPDPYLITNQQGHVSDANRAAGEMLKVERRLLIGKPLQVFVPPAERSDFCAKMRQAQDGQAPIEWRMRVMTRTGALVDVAAAVGSVLDRQGAVVGLRWSLRDITSQVRAEDRLLDRNAELERRVADRTAALEAATRAKDELLVRERAARDAAEDANRSKDEFLATISHELRTPLNVVLGWTYRIMARTLDAQQSERAVEIIDRNARQQLHLVEELLDSARIATGRVELELDTHELGPLLEAGIEAHDATAAARSITITSAIAVGVYVRADPVRLRQIAWNLLSNALKFTAEGGTVHLSLRTEHDHAIVDVSDSGIGISPLALSHVFEPFWQAELSTRRARSGLGLGLAIVKHLVELHGGTINAASGGSGQGATFKVRLPLVAGPPGDAASTSTP
jgi:PAS domain S-box-containing protein